MSSEVFHPDRGNILAALLMAGISVIVIGFAPLKLFWILIFPAVFIYWVLRSRTVVGEDGITVTRAFVSDTAVGWDQVDGIGFKGARTFLRTTDGRSHSLPGVTFNSIPRLAEASRGRIPDTVTAAAEAADGKMEVIDRDGNKILLTQEQYREHLAEKQAAKEEPKD